jgi:hypothetical protein
MTYPLGIKVVGAAKRLDAFSRNNGDNTFLDEKLEQLGTIDSAMGYPRM